MFYIKNVYSYTGKLNCHHTLNRKRSAQQYDHHGNSRQTFLASRDKIHVEYERESPWYWLMRPAHWVNTLVGEGRRARLVTHWLIVIHTVPVSNLHVLNLKLSEKRNFTVFVIFPRPYNNTVDLFPAQSESGKCSLVRSLVTESLHSD